MGASLALSIREHFPQCVVCGVTRNAASREAAVNEKRVHEAFDCVENLLEKHTPDLIIIATPVSIIPSIVNSIDKNVSSSLVVTDVGSTKSLILNEIAKLNLENVSFIGSHPMCGSHQAGYSAAQSNLYESAYCFITQTLKTCEEARELVKSFWESIGVKTIVVAPDFHDGLVSKVSHLPHAIAMMLVNYICASQGDVYKYVGTGFLDTTRVAQSDAHVWTDIFLENKSNILDDLVYFKNEIDRLIDIIKTDDKEILYSFLNSVSEKRKSMEG